MENLVNRMKTGYGHEDKGRLIEFIHVLVNLADKAYLEGLLSLEDIIPFLQQPLLRKGIEKILDGCDEKELESFFTNYIQTTELSELELQESLFIKEGLLHIQKGDKGSCVSKKLYFIWSDKLS